MRKLFTNVKAWVTASLLVPAALASAQYSGAYQMASFGYTYGITPTGTNVADANAAYNYWKDNFVTASQGCGFRRVIFDFYPGGLGKTDKSQTVSEGIAYGMLLAAYRGDRTLFDDLWSYYKSKRNGNGVMNWKIENCGVIGQNGATDAELDVAMSLIIASEQWQTDSYLNDAKSLIAIIRTKEFEGNVQKPGDVFGGSTLTNPSYYSPAYYRVFKTYDGNANFWDAAAAQGYTTIAGSPGAAKGLVPDWTNASGGYSTDPLVVQNKYTDLGKSFFFDAVRTPFRSAIDYLWHNNADALAYLNKFNTWAVSAHGGSPGNIGSKYDMNGNKTQSYNNATFSACFAIAAMGASNTTNQAWLNSNYSHLKNVNVGNGEYFNATFKAIGLFVMTGNFYLPKQCANKPELGADKSLCAGASVSLSTTAVSGATYSWKKDGVAIAGTTNTLTATTSGIYELTMVSGTPSCAARDKVTVFGSTLTADFIAVPAAGSIIITDNTIGGAKGTTGTGYTYTVTPPAGPATTYTTPSFTISNVVTGKYTIKLDVTNAGYGCTGTSTITKIVAVGDGAGMAIDDFAEANQRQLYTSTWGGNIEPIAKTYCSRSDYEAQGAQECPVFSCGVAEIKCKAGTGNQNWHALGVTFADATAPYDLTTTPFVQIRAKATSAVTVGVKLNQKVGTTVDFTNNTGVSSRMALTTEYQVFNLDFTALKAGYNNAVGANATIAAWNSVAGIQILPFDVSANFVGTVTVDYIIVGGKALPAPNFNIKKDDLGFTDYGVYLKDYYPNDPKYAACTPSTPGSGCYGSVPDWKKKVDLCGTATTLTANSCTATGYKWLKDGAVVGTSSTYSATSGGTYVVELSNAGGITRDTVVVNARTLPVADFSVEQNNFGTKFFNNSTTYNTWVWDFGNIANFEDQLAQTTVWDPAYYGYPAAGTYNVKLTVKDTVCNKTATVTKPITVTCTGPSTFDLLSSSADATYCKGEVVTYTTKVPTKNAANYKWFLPLNATGVETKDTLGVAKDTVRFKNVVTYGLNSSGPVELQVYGNCLDKKSSDIITVTVIDPVKSDFEQLVLLNKDDKIFFNEKTSNATSLTWNFNAPNSVLETASTNAKPIVSFKKTGDYNVCLKADNNICNTTDTKCKPVSITVVGVNDGQELSAKFVAFPNPAEGGEIHFSKVINNVTVIDALGNEITTANAIESLDISGLAAGIYFIKADEGTLRVVVK